MTPKDIEKLMQLRADRFDEKGQWLAQFKSHELAELMDAAIHSGEAADELLGLLLQPGVPAHSVYDNIGPYYQHYLSYAYENWTHEGEDCRDQVWFADKDVHGEAHPYPLTRYLSASAT